MILPTGTGGKSSELALAQERLLQRRLSLRQQRIGQDREARRDGDDCGPGPSPALAETANLRDLLEALPPHLGWYSQTLPRAIQVRPRESATAPQALHQPTLNRSEPRLPTPRKEVVALYPDLALAMLRDGLVASGRLWLLLRFLDNTGRGWLPDSLVRQELTGPEASLPLCGTRQLRNLLSQGEGTFWTRSGNRLWLHSVPRVAASLHLSKLKVSAVTLPVTALLGSIGTVRAHFYASFHSSRISRSSAGRHHAKPIARLTLEKIAHVTRHTQRRYEVAAGVRRQTNVAVGAPLSAIAMETRAQKHGHAIFEFKDAQGRLGPAGQVYVAWQLPNSYLGPHQQKSRQQRRRLNRRLAGLLQKGMTGNGKDKPGKQQSRPRQRFHCDGRQAVRAYSQRPTEDAYWPERTTQRGARIWHVLEE